MFKNSARTRLHGALNGEHNVVDRLVAVDPLVGHHSHPDARLRGREMDRRPRALVVQVAC